MSILDLIRRQDTSNTTLDSRDLVARYQRLRRVCKELNSAMTGRLGRDVLFEGGRKLGLLRGDTFVFDSEDETAVLMDYCLYHVRRNGCNTVEQYCCDHPAAPGSDEAVCLRAMQNTVYSLFRVVATEPGVAVVVTDLATDEQFLLVDIGLSQTAKPGLLLFSRLMLFEDFAATTGAAIPLGNLPADEAAAFGASWKKVSLSRTADYDPAPVIQECLQRGATGQTRYLDPAKAPMRKPQTRRVSRQARAALLKGTGKPDPTRRCPCGSGKMFKNCCLKKPR